MGPAGHEAEGVQSLSYQTLKSSDLRKTAPLLKNYYKEIPSLNAE
jgi:hypothetical protein